MAYDIKVIIHAIGSCSREQVKRAAVVRSGSCVHLLGLRIDRRLPSPTTDDETRPSLLVALAGDSSPYSFFVRRNPAAMDRRHPVGDDILCSDCSGEELSGTIVVSVMLKL